MIEFNETLPVAERWRVSQRINAFTPTHWATVRLGDLANVQNGFPFESKSFNATAGFPVIRIRDVGRDDTTTLYNGAYDESYVVRPGDILITMDGEFRCRRWQGRPALLNQRVCRVTPRDGLVNDRYLFLVLQPHLTAVEAVTSSITVRHLSSKTIENLEIALPSFAEQCRIADAYDAVQARSRLTCEALEAVLPLLEQFRQSVLAAAFRGDLTAEWRKESPTAASPRSGENYLPTSWHLTTFGELTTDSFYGPRFSADEYAANGVPTIRTTDMDRRGQIVLATPPRVSITEPKLEKLGLQDGDLLVTRTGSIGKCAVYDRALGPALPSAYLIRFRLHKELVSPRFALYFLLSAEGQRQLGIGVTAVTQPNINARAVSSIRLPLPPLHEQSEIVARIDSLMTLIEGLGGRHTATIDELDALNRSILAKAFRGELVPQDPNDEPASVLLERIRAEREAAGGTKRRGRRAAGAAK